MMNSMMRLHLGKMQSVFRVLRWAEAVGIVLFFLRGAPSLARASGDFLRISASVLVGPRFLFLLGNAIVILLFFNKHNTNTIDDGTSIISSFVPPAPVLEVEEEEEEEEVVFEDKEVLVQVSSKLEEEEEYSSNNNYRRSRSEKIDVRRPKGSPAPELRRSKTGVDPPKKEEEEMQEKELGDAEEFRRTIEAFIEKQLKFQRQESMSMSMSVSVSTNLLAIASVQEDQGGEDGVKEKE